MPVTINGTTGIAGVDGSASTPAVQGTDTNTGIFFPAADTIAFGEGGAEAMRIDSSGNVGIGTSSPSGKLHVAGTANFNTTATSGDFRYNGQIFLVTDSQIAFRGTGDYIYSPAANTIAVLTGGTERARITSNGYFYVNTTAGASGGNDRMSVYYSSNTGPCLTLRDTNAQNGNTFIGFYNGATFAGSITSNGTTTMTYGSASDYRLKSNPQPIQNALATVSALNPVSFTWNQSGEQGIGFIAHEVQAVMPDCVVGQKDAEDDNGNPLYQMIDTGSASLIATLTAAIQELKSELDAAKARIAVLEAK